MNQLDPSVQALKARLENGFGAQEQAALVRLFSIARNDSGQSRRVADFLLAWWNSQTMGRWDMLDLWAVDEQIGEDMLTILSYLAGPHKAYPDTLGYKTEFHAVIKAWRPDIKFD